jgi:histidinol-phosphatase (PHP family)
MKATYHNHTSWSDGQCTVAEMVAEARRLGIDELGISDHLVLHPDGTVPEDWSMLPEQVQSYVAELQAERADDGPAIRIGLEVDWFPERRDAVAGLLSTHPLDFVIGSVHEVDGFEIDYRATAWQQLDVGSRNQVHRRYWQQIRSMAESRLFDIVGHLDLTKKFGYRPTVDLSEEMTVALDAIAAADLVVELSTAGWHLPCQESYPSIALLEQCRQRQIPVMIASDAHVPQHLIRDFDRAAELLLAAGYTQVARFAERRRSLVDL